MSQSNEEHSSVGTTDVVSKAFFILGLACAAMSGLTIMFIYVGSKILGEPAGSIDSDGLIIMLLGLILACLAHSKERS